MTYQELNEAVARKLGWKKLKKLDDSTGYLYGWTFKGELRNPPLYSTSIAAAWEILLNHKGDWTLTRQNDMFHCELFIPSYQQEAWAHTAPLAICEAFLKLEA